MQIEFINYDLESGNFHFKYLGTEETFISVLVSYYGLTVHKAEFNARPNPDVIFFISINEHFLEYPDYLKFTIKTNKETKDFLIQNRKTSLKYKRLDSFKTDTEDISYYTYSEIFDKEIYNSNVVKVERGDFVLDLGSNYGFFAKYSELKGAKKIVCYEPSKRVFEYLETNFINNSKVDVYNIAVSSFDGVSKFSEHENSCSSSIGVDGYDVDVRDINTVIDLLCCEKIDFLKIDIEGEEKNVIESLTIENSKKIKKLVVEYHSSEIKEFVLNKLLELNFVIEKDENSLIYAYNLQLFDQKKKIVCISTYCNNLEKQNILKENIDKLKSIGLDVMVISPIELPQTVVEKCDYYFRTKDNPLLVWPVRMYTHWYELQLPDGRITTLQRGLADYGWAGLFQVKKLSEMALSYDYEIFYHMIYDLDIDEVVEKELILFNTNILHPRRDPHHPEILWETTLHFMVFDRPMMEKITKEIQLYEYLRTNGVAEGEVLKWKNKYGIPTSNHPVRDKIFYWEDYDFFDYSPFPNFKLFISKNEKMNIWLGENPPYETELTDNLRFVFHSFEDMDEIKIIINEEEFLQKPKSWEIIEIPISSQNIETIKFEYNGNLVDFTSEYEKIMFNQIYYNHRP